VSHAILNNKLTCFFLAGILQLSPFFVFECKNLVSDFDTIRYSTRLEFDLTHIYYAMLKVLARQKIPAYFSNVYYPQA
jgi:hypothetical protein